MGFSERKAATPQYPDSPPPAGSLRRGWHPSALLLWVSRELHGNPEAGGPRAADSEGLRAQGVGEPRKMSQEGSSSRVKAAKLLEGL